MEMVWLRRKPVWPAPADWRWRQMARCSLPIASTEGFGLSILSLVSIRTVVGDGGEYRYQGPG